MDASCTSGGCLENAIRGLSNQYINSNCLTIAQCKEIAKKGKYVNFSAKILKIIARDLSGTAMKLWQFLSAESIFDSNWSVKISINYIATYLNRSYRQSQRLIDELLTKGYIEKIGKKGRISEFAVRLPIAIAKEFNSLKPRRCSKTHDKNVQGKSDHSFYYYINTNNRAKTKAETVNASPAQDAVVKNSPKPKPDNSELIKKLEIELAELNRKFDENCHEMLKNPRNTDQLFEIHRKISEKIGNVTVKINNLKPIKSPEKLNFMNSPGKRIISDFEKMRLTKSLKLSTSEQSPLLNEIAYSVRFGSLTRSKEGGEMPVARGISIALKLVRENRWTKPIGMQQ